MNTTENTTISYLKLLYQSIYLPVQYYLDHELTFHLPSDDIPFNFAEPFLNLLMTSKKEVHYITTNEFLYFGIIRNFSSGEDIVVGPISTMHVKSEQLPRILLECSIPPQYKDAVWNFFQMTPAFSHEQFLNLLALIHKELNDDMIDPVTYFGQSLGLTLTTISEKHSTQLYQAKEEESFHNSFHFEQELFHYVEEGNVNALQNLTQKSRRIHAGLIGENSLRQEKNIFIATLTMITRHSISGGLEIETAYQLSDTYIQESEKAQTIEAVNRLSYTALLDFTNRVASCKIPQGMSSDIYQCIQYISTHTNQHISVGAVADFVGKSPSYISKKFKKELGFNLNDFIMRKKLEEAKSPLSFTDKPISEISEYLCFSSQPYFQNVFKKKYHMTPYEYRKRSAWIAPRR